MAHCFALEKDGQRCILADLDNLICKDVLGVEPSAQDYHPAFWLGVGLRLAAGHTLQEIATDTERGDTEARKIAQWLIDNGYTPHAWREF